MAKFEKQITLGTDPYTGKRIRTRIRAETKTEFEQKVKEALRQFGKTGKQSTVTFAVYSERWFDVYSANLADHTRRNAQSTFKKMNDLKHMKMQKITRTDLQKIINDHWNHPSAVKKLYNMMHQIWASAVIDGVVDKDITLGLKRPPVGKSGRRALTSEELEALKKVKLPEQQRFFADVMIQFGLRPQEALALMPRDFDRKTRTLHITKAVTYDKARKPYFKSTKTGVTRDLPIPDEFWEKIPEIKTLYYFTNPSGNLLPRTTANKMFRRIIDATNEEMGGTKELRLATFTMYCIRHSKATQLYYLPGVSMKKKAEYMGHSEEMFIKIYSHLDNSKEDVELLRKMVV